VGGASPGLKFIPATLVPRASAASVTVRLPGDVCIEIGDPAAASATWIAGLVAELGKVAS